MLEHPFFERLREETKEAGVKLILEEKDTLKYPGSQSPVNGYFTHVPVPVLGLAIGKPVEKFQEALYHEYCHMQQWLDNDPTYWGVFITATIDAHDILDLWCDKLIELNEAQLQNYIQRTITCELDCERRTVQLLVLEQVDIDPHEYSQRASSYVLFYHMVGKYRQWYKAGKEPYFLPEIWTHMPEDLYSIDYKVFPQKDYEDRYREYCLDLESCDES